MSPRPVDLVIIGASFAGLLCAKTAALRGLRTVVIEAKEEPGARIHTTGILVKEPHNWISWGGKEQRPPRIVIEAGAVVEGTLRFEREVELYVHESAKIGTIEGAEAKRFSGDPPKFDR